MNWANPVLIEPMVPNRWRRTDGAGPMVPHSFNLDLTPDLPAIRAQAIHIKVMICQLEPKPDRYFFLSGFNFSI